MLYVTCYNIFMGIIVLLPQYIFWHYTRSLRDFSKISGNLLWFIWNFFSIEILLKTFTSPWRRLGRDEGARRPSFFSNLVINVVMRLSGIVIRSGTIFVGLGTVALTAFIFALSFLFWLAAPFLIFLIFLYGISFF